MGEHTSETFSVYSGKRVPIVLASSAYYAPYMAVTIQSILDSSSKDNSYEIVVLHREIEADVAETVKKMANGHDNISIRFLKIQKQFESVCFNFRTDVAAATESFYCVLLQTLLPEYEKCICIDCDVIVRNDIAELYDVDVDGFLIGAVHDIDGIGNCYGELANGNPAASMQGRSDYMTNTMGLEKVEDYFQSGVMLLNLKEWRQTYTIEQILNVACSDWIKWGDQDTMNVLCKNRVRYIDMSWNVIVNHRNKQLKMALLYGPRWLLDEYAAARSAPKIVHYAGTKPWETGFCDMFVYFWETALKSPFYREIYGRALKHDEEIKDEDTSLETAQEMIKLYLNGEIGLRWIIPQISAWIKYKLRGGK